MPTLNTLGKSYSFDRRFQISLFYHITHKSIFSLVAQINDNTKVLYGADGGPPIISDPIYEFLNVAQQCSFQ